MGWIWRSVLASISWQMFTLSINVSVVVRGFKNFRIISIEWGSRVTYWIRNIIYKENNKRSRIDLWGTSHVIVFGLDSCIFTRHCWTLLFTCDWSHLIYGLNMLLYYHIVSLLVLLHLAKKKYEVWKSICGIQISTSSFFGKFSPTIISPRTKRC